MSFHEHPEGHSMQEMIASPSALEAHTTEHIHHLFAAEGYTHIDAEDASRRNADVPASAFVRTSDGSIIHVGLQSSNQYWINVIVKDAQHPTPLEKKMMTLYTNGYRDIGNVKEGTEFTEYIAQTVTGPIREERAGIVKRARALFGSAA